MRNLRMLMLLFVSIGLLSVGGCSRKDATTGNKVTLRLVVWGTQKDEADFNKALESFRKQHPDIQVKLEITPHARVFDKLLISFAGGRAPDISRVSSFWFYPLAAKGVLKDLTPLIEQDKTFDLNDFYPIALDGWGRYQGKVHALPTDLDLYALYYNKKIFDKAGIAYPDATWDWNKYLSVAKQLTRDTDGDGKIDQYGTTMDSFWQSYIWQNGGDILNTRNTRCLLDQPEAYKALQWMVDLRQKHGVTPSPADQADIGQLGLWTTGRIAMYHSGSWAASMLFKERVTTFDWDVAPLPVGKQRATFLGGAGYAMMKDTRHPKEAWELLKFLSSPMMQARAAKEDQIMPARRSVAESGAFLNLKERPANRRVFIDALEYGHTLPNVYSVKEMNDIVNNYISKAILGRASAKEVCLEVAPKVNALLLYDKNKGVDVAAE